MGVDRRGNPRGKCTACDCNEFELSPTDDNTNVCFFCGHHSPLHERMETNEETPMHEVTVLAIENVTGPAYNEVNNADHPQQILQSASNAAEQENNIIAEGNNSEIAPDRTRDRAAIELASRFGLARMENKKYSSADRKRKTYLAYSVVLFVVFAFAVFAHGGFVVAERSLVALVVSHMLFVTSVFLVIFLLCDLTLRLCQTLVSLTTDVGQQSEESFWSVARYHFSFNTPSATMVIVSVLLFLVLTMMVRMCPVSFVWSYGPHVCVPLMIFSFCLLRMSNLTEWKIGSLSDLSIMKGLDYGTGMAYNFYYGYLQLILPSTEISSSKGIIEKIENFEDNHTVTFPVHKMFILIPSSGYIPPDLKEASYQWMESASELEEEKRNRAGNIGRTYRNNVYKIYPGGRNSGNDPVYTVVEGATPLLTYFEVQKHNHPESTVYKRYKRKIIEMFYRKLQEALQSEPKTRGLCELIYYDDYDVKGDKVNVATIILERISKIKNSASVKRN